MTPKAGTLQQRMKEQARREVATTAMALFVDNGFDATTVDQICAATGMSRRSFFRYFKGKEALVVSLLDGLAEAGSKVFIARPADEDVWTALRHCMDPFVDWSEENRARALEIIRLVEETPGLRAAYLATVDQWRASLAILISRRLGLSDEHRLYASVVSAASMGAFVAGGREWQSDGGEAALADVFDRAFAAMSPNSLDIPG
ncbi:TetR family transcriptional regulator [Nocardioides sp. NPDC058538]|uniref:acyl-CoA-like ligand-binding transcription factor n=1 Tax=Nocardioides sp. NPDC058538 TaxID=3346542 RepID=UPI00364A06FE